MISVKFPCCSNKKVKIPLSSREIVRQHDRKASTLTQFLFHKDAYDPSLYDVVINRGVKDVMLIIRQIMQHYNDIESWFGHIQGVVPYGAADAYCSCGRAVRDNPAVTVR
jgi:hypothetical protein